MESEILRVVGLAWGGAGIVPAELQLELTLRLGVGADSEIARNFKLRLGFAADKVNTVMMMTRMIVPTNNLNPRNDSESSSALLSLEPRTAMERLPGHDPDKSQMIGPRGN